jgi:hypothetical protein
VAKQGNDPGELVGRVVGYLLRHRRRDVAGVLIRPK